jgi:hypothetical protein
MLEQSRKYPLVFAVSVHPFIIGQRFRLRAIRHIVRHRDRLWITMPGEIALLRELAKRHNAGIAVAHGSRGPIPVRNLPNTAKVWEAVQRRPAARRAGLGCRMTPFTESPAKI